MRVTAKSGDIIEIGIEGHSNCNQIDGFVSVLMRNAKGEWELYVFADIESEEPTHVINLNGAREPK